MKQKFLIVFILLLSIILRFYKLDQVPPGLYQDEASIALNAYDVLKTGKDEYGISHPMFFKSFGDYKLPVYVYSTSISMAVFGKNDFAVRFPSALAGVIAVLLFYFLLRQIFEKEKLVAPLGALLLATSPWHIQFSRGGFEANLAFTLYLAGLFLLMLFLKQKKGTYLIISYIFLAIAVYTYHAYKLLSPLTVFASLVYFYINFKNEKNKIVSALVVFLAILLPIVGFSLTQNGSQRLVGTSAFNELPGLTPIQKLYEYPALFIRNYLSYFSFGFLFDTGDGIGRHQIHNFGPMLKWQLPFLITGVYALLKKKTFIKSVVLFLLFIVPIPAAIAAPSPHALRSLLMVIPLLSLVTLGIIFWIEKLSKYKVFLAVAILAVATYEFLFYSHYYYVHYPQVNALDWGGGYEETAVKAQALSKSYDEVIVDKNLKFVSTYLDFYAPNMKYEMVDVTWKKPNSWTNKKVLYIRPYYGQQEAPGIIYSVRLQNKTRDVFSQLWEL